MDIIVKANPIKEPQGATIAVATIEFENMIKIRNVTVKSGKNGRFVSMPNYATRNVDEEGRTIYRDVCNPITKEGRELIYGAVLRSLDEKVEIRIPVETEKPDLSVSCVPYEGKGGVVGMARIYLNDFFVVNNVTIRTNQDKRDETAPNYYVAYPSYKANTVDENGRHEYKNFCYPSSKEARGKIDSMILDKFEEAKELSQTAPEITEEESSFVKEESPPTKGIKEKLKDGKQKKEASSKPKDRVQTKAVEIS